MIKYNTINVFRQTAREMMESLELGFQVFFFTDVCTLDILSLKNTSDATLSPLSV